MENVYDRAPLRCINDLSNTRLEMRFTVMWNRWVQPPVINATIACLALIGGCRPEQNAGSALSPSQPVTSAPKITLTAPVAPPASPIRFENVAAASGVDFMYYGNPSPEHFMTEQNGGGCGLIDYDADGRLDLFLPNGSNYDRPSKTATHALYRSTGLLRYANNAQAARVAVTGYGMGCAVGDYDNDGFDDLFLTGYQSNHLWHNQGDGTFVEVVLETSADQRLWATSAAFADLNGDAALDLYVVNYVDYAPTDPPCFTQQTPPVKISCGPIGRTGQADLLYQNLANGGFENVSQPAGITAVAGKGLGVSIADFDGDDRLDLYVACDTTENLLWQNLGDLRFEENALSRGAAVGADGRARSGMGIACGDYNGDSRFDLFVTNFQNEPNDLYENLGPAGFLARNADLGLDAITRPGLGFGTVFADFDLDQQPDLFVTNGHVWDLTSLGLSYEFAMRPFLLRNDQGQKFQDGTSAAGDYFQQKWIGRGAAVGDLDNDGDADLVVTHLVEPTAVLRNDSERSGRSLVLKLVGTRSARQPLGARVDVVIAGQRLTLRCPAGDSFQSAHDVRLIVPVGAADHVDSVTVHWPGREPETRGSIAVASQLIWIEDGPLVPISD
ncbi:CRTAC1 family protein [bacterium]|nr:CRTAC1 family protein [bacterium]